MKKGLVFLFLFSLLFLSLVSAGELKVTNEHPFLINNKWISASQLQIGNYLTTIDGKKARITNIEEVNQPVQVYNFEDDIFHNYVSNRIIVHNSLVPASGIKIQSVSAEYAELNGVFDFFKGVFGDATFELSRLRILTGKYTVSDFDIVEAYTKQVLTEKGVEFQEAKIFNRRSMDEHTIYTITPSDATPLNKLAKISSQRSIGGKPVKIFIDPLNVGRQGAYQLETIINGETVPAILFDISAIKLSGELRGSLVGVPIEHEYGHMLVDRDFFGRNNPDLIQTEKMVNIMEPTSSGSATSDVPYAQGFRTDEIYQYWRDMTVNLQNLRKSCSSDVKTLNQDLIQQITGNANLIKDLAARKLKASVDSYQIIQQIKKADMLTKGAVVSGDIVTIGVNNGNSALLLTVKKAYNIEYLEVRVASATSNEVSTVVLLRDPVLIGKVKAQISQTPSGTVIVDGIYDVVKKDVAPQLEALIDISVKSAQHNFMASELIIDDSVGASVRIKEGCITCEELTAKLNKLADFVAKTQEINGASTYRGKLDLSTYYGAPLWEIQQKLGL